MKKLIILLFVGILPLVGFGQTDLVRWNGANLQPNAFLIVNNGTISANPVGGSFVTDNYSQPFPGFRGTNYNTSSATPDYTNYMEFAIKANATNEIKLTKFSFTHASGVGGPQKFEIRYSTDSSIGTAIDGITSVSQIPTPKTVNLTGITVQPGQTFYIRVYPFNRQNPGWNGGTFHIKHGTPDSNATPNSTGPTFIGTVHSTLPPVAVNDFTFTTQSTPVVINILQNDTHNTLSAITVNQAPTNGTLQVNGLNNITYTPNTNYTGVDTFKYKLTDNIGTSNVGTVNITVNETNPTDLVRWNGANNSLAAVIPVNTPVTASTLSVVGGGTITNLYQNIFQANNGWPTPTQNSGYLNPNKYIEFTINSKDGYQLVANKLNLRMKTQGDAGKFEVRYSKDFSENYFSYNGILTSNFQNFSINISSANPVLASETLYVRIYIYSIYNLLEIQHDNGGNVGPSISGTLSMPVDPITTWNGEAGWSNGVPTINRDAIIVEDYLLVPNEILAAKNLTINATAKVTVANDAVLLVQKNVNIIANGEASVPQLIVENNGSFVQVDDNATFTGAANSFLMKRNSQPVYRLDYTYWSSPIKSGSGFTLKKLSPLTLASKYYKWNNAWAAVNAVTEVMVPAKGYIVRAPQNFDIQGQPGAVAKIDNIEFKGEPNNGIVNIAINGDKNWNLVGNPYPSALSIDAFYSNLANSSKLGGTIYLWTHNTPIGDLTNTGIYNYSPSDYASYNKSGGTATGSGSEEVTPTGYVAAGQAFFVQGEAAGTIEFNNAMRVAQGGLNNQFFKQTPSQPIENWATTGKHRVWLNLTSAQNDFNQALVGYIENATNDLDWGYDGVVFSGGAVSLYSVLNDKTLTIQGRALPFSNQDEVPLGYKTTLTGTLKISIDHLDGLFAGQNIFLKDNVLNIVHNLKDSDYSFTTVPGTFDDRFVLRYLPEANLAKDIPTINANSVVAFNTNNQISIKSTEHVLKQIEIYDIQGRVLFSKNNINAQDFATQSLAAANQMVVVKITADNNAELITKVMLK